MRREPFQETGSALRVDVTFATGAGSDGFTQDPVASVDVEDRGGAKFLVLTTPATERVYVALDRVLVVRTRPSERGG